MAAVQEPDATAEVGAKRGRRLSEERSEHILQTVLEMLGAEGYDHLRMQDVADRAGVGLSTIYRRWPTKQDVVRAALQCEGATEKYVDTGDPRADVKAVLTRMAEDLSGDGAQAMLGFLATMRSDPEIAEVFRDTAISRLNEHLRNLLAQELGDDHPELDLRAMAGPAILTYQAAICGKPYDAEEMAERLTDLLFAPTER
jgi:AcrR family transcriptional regulator